MVVAFLPTPILHLLFEPAIKEIEEKLKYLVV